MGFRGGVNSEISLEGTRVSLVPLRLEHVAELLRHAADPTLWTWWLRRPPVDEATMRAEIALALQQQATGRRRAFAIFHHERGECVGSTSFLNIDREHRSVEIGSTWLGSAFHGGGINAECKALLLAHAFGPMGMHRVALQTDALNTRSRRAIEKLGARLDGVMRDDRLVWDGRVRSSAVYSLLRTDVQSGALGKLETGDATHASVSP